MHWIFYKRHCSKQRQYVSHHKFLDSSSHNYTLGLEDNTFELSVVQWFSETLSVATHNIWNIIECTIKPADKCQKIKHTIFTSKVSTKVLYWHRSKLQLCAYLLDPINRIFQKNSPGWTIISADIWISQIFAETTKFS